MKITKEHLIGKAEQLEQDYEKRVARINALLASNMFNFAGAEFEQLAYIKGQAVAYRELSLEVED